MYEVACYLTWLNLIGSSIANATEECFNNCEPYPYLTRLKFCLPQAVLALVDGLEDKIHDQGAKEKLLAMVNPMSNEAALSYIRDCQASRFYTNMLMNQARIVQDLQTLSSKCMSGEEDVVRLRRLCRLSTNRGRTYPMTFLIPTVFLVAVIPAAIAWRLDQLSPGSTRDSNFWQTFASSLLQLLSLVTFLWPVQKNSHMPSLTRVWIWILAGFSATCAIVGVPMYLVGATIWSFIISFAGSLGQAVMQLQVINAI